MIEERGLGLPPPDLDGDDYSHPTAIDDSRLPEEDKRIHFMEMVKNDDVFAIRVTMLVEDNGFFHWKVEDVPI